jgi:hypothetical protein
LKFKKHTFFFLIVAINFGFILQGDAPAYTIKQTYNYFTSDNIGNTYLVNGEELIKYNSNGQLFKKYSNKQFGNITMVDATNALKILLYYKDFQNVVFIDDQLSQNGDLISFEDLGYEQTDLVCTSFNNSFWIYNKQNNELVRFNENSQPVAKTGNLKQVLQAEIKPNFMLEQNSYLYLNCPAIGIYVFDIYGTFNKIISIKNLSSFQVNNGILYYFKDRQLVSYDPKTFEEKNETFKDTLIKTVRIEKDWLFTQYNDSLKAFVNKPK